MTRQHITTFELSDITNLRAACPKCDGEIVRKIEKIDRPMKAPKHCPHCNEYWYKHVGGEDNAFELFGSLMRALHSNDSDKRDRDRFAFEIVED